MCLARTILCCLFIDKLNTSEKALNVLKPDTTEQIGQNQQKDIFMGRRRDRRDKRREKQIKTRKANAPRKAKERARKAAKAAGGTN